MIASSTARNTTRLFSGSAKLGLYRHRIAIASAGIHTTRKSTNAVTSP